MPAGHDIQAHPSNFLIPPRVPKESLDETKWHTYDVFDWCFQALVVQPISCKPSRQRSISSHSKYPIVKTKQSAVWVSLGLFLISHFLPAYGGSPGYECFIYCVQVGHPYYGAFAVTNVLFLGLAIAPLLTQ